jgi:hypothetical protein
MLRERVLIIAYFIAGIVLYLLYNDGAYKYPIYSELYTDDKKGDDLYKRNNQIYFRRTDYHILF